MSDIQLTQDTIKRLADGLAASVSGHAPEPGFFKSSDLFDEDLEKAVRILSSAGIEISNEPSHLRISHTASADPALARAVLEFSDFTHQLFKLVPGFMASLSVKEFVDSYEKIRKGFNAAHASVLVASGVNPKPKSSNRFLAALSPDTFVSEVESKEMMAATAEKVPEIEAESMATLKKFSVYFDQISALVLAEHHVLASGERLLTRISEFAPLTQDGKMEKDLLIQTLLGVQASASAMAHTSLPLVDSLSVVNHSAIAFLSQQPELLDRSTKNHAARQDVHRAQEALDSLMKAATSADAVLKKNPKPGDVPWLIADQALAVESALESSSSSYADKINGLLSGQPLATPRHPATATQQPPIHSVTRLSDIAPSIHPKPPTQFELARQKRVQRVFVEKMGFQSETSGLAQPALSAFAPVLLSSNQDAVSLLCHLLGGPHAAVLSERQAGQIIDWSETEHALRLLNLAADLCVLESRPQLTSEAPASVEKLKKDVFDLQNHPGDLDLASRLFIGPILVRAACLFDFGPHWVSSSWRSMPLSGLPLDQWGDDFRDTLAGLPANSTTAAALEKSAVLPKECLDGFFDRLSIQDETLWRLPDPDQGYLRPQPAKSAAMNQTESARFDDVICDPVSPSAPTDAVRTRRALSKIRSSGTKSTGPR